MLIDLKKLVDNLSTEKVIQLVQDLGADRYEEKENYVIFPTICHNESSQDANMKLYYYKKNKKFHCYTDCGDNFNILELFKRRYELLGIVYDFFKDIVLKIAEGENYQSIPSDFGQYYEKIDYHCHDFNPKVEFSILPSSLLNVFKFYPTPEWLKDGIDIEQMKRYKILFSINQNKIIIPHYDIENNLIGIRGRALNEEDILIGKYMPVQIEGKIYSHPLGYNLYGLNLTKENIKKKKFAILFEGEKSVLLYEKYFGIENNIAAAVCGSTVSHYQIKLLMQLGVEKVIIAFDNPSDMTNGKEKNNHYLKMKKMCEKYSRIINMGFIIDNQNLLGNKESPIDKGKDIFEKLIKNTQWI